MFRVFDRFVSIMEIVVIFLRGAGSGKGNCGPCHRMFFGSQGLMELAIDWNSSQEMNFPRAV